MTVVKKINSKLKSLKRDESGSMAVAWAISAIVMIGVIGAGIDFAKLSNMKQKTQSMADNAALAAAIYVKNNGQAPTGGDAGFVEGRTYSALDLMARFPEHVIEGDAGVKLDVVYDDNAKEVIANVSASSVPILMQVFGYEQFDFKSKAVASYLDIDDKFPASIALVLDNSGSMQFDDKLPERIYDVTHDRTCWRRVRWQWQSYNCPWTHKHGDQKADAEIRLDGLKSSVTLFQTELESRLGTETTNERRTLRMGMLPYSSAIIASGQRDMNWGYIPEGTPATSTTPGTGIKGMVADGGTNSSPPMSTVKTWLEAEDAIHEQEAERAGVPDDKDPLKFVIFMTDGQNTVGNWGIIPGPTGQWHRETSPGNFSTSGSAQSGWTEGTLTLLTDTETVDSCQAMKAQGVKIFTIGYALEDHGDFRVNGWNNNEDDSLITVSSGVRSAAYSLMQSCASTEDHFITAADASQLEAAFDEIQNAIVEELIRLKS